MYTEEHPTPGNTEDPSSFRRFSITVPPDAEEGVALPVLLGSREYTVVVPPDGENQVLVVAVPVDQITGGDGNMSFALPNQMGGAAVGVATVVSEKSDNLAIGQAYSFGVGGPAANAAQIESCLECPACTFHNATTATSCEVCGHSPLPVFVPTATAVLSVFSPGALPKA